jgi:hypothetical protein
VAGLQVGDNRNSAGLTTATSEAGFFSTIGQVYKYRRFKLSCFPLTKVRMQLSLLTNVQLAEDHVKDTVSKIGEIRCSGFRPLVMTNFNTVV